MSPDRRRIAQVIREAEAPTDLVAELERWSSYRFTQQVGSAACHRLDLARWYAATGTEPDDIPPEAGSAEEAAARIIGLFGSEFAEAFVTAVAEREDAVATIGERLEHAQIAFEDGFWNGADDDEDWLVEPVLARGRGHLLYAPPKAGKSLFALYLAACLATGREVLGRPAGEPVRVVYVDVEMTEADVRARLRAMGFGPSDDLSALRYVSLPLPALSPLDTKEGGEELLNLALDHDAELVVLDTIGKLVQGDENANDTAQNFAIYTGTPLKAAGVTLLRIDHSGKGADRGARGGSAKNDDPDVVWRLGSTPGRLKLKAPYKRVPWVPDEVSLRMAYGPILYRLEARASEQTAAADVAILNDAGMPLLFGSVRARRFLEEAGISMSHERLAEALRLRKLGRDGAEGER